MSCIERCPHFRGIFIYTAKCPLRGVPLYNVNRQWMPRPTTLTLEVLVVAEDHVEEGVGHLVLKVLLRGLLNGVQEEEDKLLRPLVWGREEEERVESSSLRVRQLGGGGGGEGRGEGRGEGSRGQGASDLKMAVFHQRLCFSNKGAQTGSEDWLQLRM